MEYRVDDRSLSGETFLDFVQQVWPGAYNLEQTRAALSKTMNFTAWDGGQLAGCLRVLTDGCFFGTITELLVLPAYQRQGIGSRLLRLAAAQALHAGTIQQQLITGEAGTDQQEPEQKKSWFSKIFGGR